MTKLSDGKLIKVWSLDVNVNFLFVESITPSSYYVVLFRYIFIPDLAPKFCLTIATQYNLRECSKLKAEAVINK